MTNRIAPDTADHPAVAGSSPRITPRTASLLARPLLVASAFAISQNAEAIGETIRISARGLVPDISGDGRYVVYQYDVIPPNSRFDPRAEIVIYDRQTGRPREITAPLKANESSWQPSISGNGRFIAFNSRASNLIPDDTNGTQDIFVWDRATHRMTRASVTSEDTK